MKKYLFSQFRSGEFEVIYQQLTTVFDIPIDELRALYQVMREEFEIEGYPEHTISRTVFHSWDQNFQARYEQAFVVGIDFPSILECANGVVEKKTIAILGQDPLRRSDKPLPEISIGTPYALHLKNCRQVLRNTRLYFDLIQVLLEAGYLVVQKTPETFMGKGFSIRQRFWDFSENRTKVVRFSHHFDPPDCSP